MSIATQMTLDDYGRLTAAGAFEQGLRRRVELIDGEVREMSPTKPPHQMLVTLLTEWSFENRPAEKPHVWIQSSFWIRQLESAPQPDVAWLVRKDYGSEQPSPQDVLLLIEVADSSLAYDCGEKANLYASAGIADYWVVNIPDKCVEVFREPVNGTYHSRQVFKTGAEVHPLLDSEISLPVKLLFPAI
ncbi:MAG: Uma2 family endonuclease [Planctomycetes bacterium]|nr:Uma2 family endonuclease [Planctomycetota bacterium]